MVDYERIVTAGIGFGFFALSLFIVNPWMTAISTAIIFIITLIFALMARKQGAPVSLTLTR